MNPVLTGTTDRDAELSIVVDPTATVLHQSAGQEDIFPIKVDMDQVRRQRETGLRGLGQVLKSFRDRDAEFSVYDRTSGADAYLQTLGPLTTPGQHAQGGLNSADPRIAMESKAEPLTAPPAFSVFEGKTGSD